MAVAGTLTYKTELDTSGYQKGINDITNKTKTGGANVKSIVAGLGITKLVSTAINTIKNSMDGAISRLDTMNNFPKVMSNLGISAKESQKAIDNLSAGLKGIPTSLDAGALAVQRFTSKNGDVQKSVDMFLAVNDAILAGGASAQIQESALEQLTQAYSRGKMDMTEWRSLQTAMPAQLKQVAKAMGLTTDELGEMLRTGNNTDKVFEEFIKTIIKMDKTGVKGFKSLKEQARNATGGIQTSITNMKTAITRGVSDMIKSFDKILKDKGLGGISGIINNIGKEAENLLKKISGWMPTVIEVLGKTIEILSKFAPAIIGIVTAVTSYKVAMGLATTATNLFTTAMSLNPVGLAVAGFVALTTALVAYTENMSKADSKTKEINDTLNEYDNKMKNIAQEREKNLSASMQEIYRYQSLYDELKKIVDENGKVKQGYEDRAKVITGQLSEALGEEISITENVIDNYQDLKNEINQTLEYKKALAYFNAHEGEYNEAIKQEITLRKEYNKALKNSNDKHSEYNKTLKIYAEHLGLAPEHLQLAVEKGKDAYGTYDDLDRVINNNSDSLGVFVYRLERMKGGVEEADDTLKKAGKTYADNQNKIYDYNQAQQALADGNYDMVYRIYNDTVTFNGKTEEANNKKYETEKSNLESYRNYLLDNQGKYNQKFLDSELSRIDKELNTLEEEKNQTNKKIEEKNKKIYSTTLTGINDQLKIFKDKSYEFRDAGNGNVDLYINGIAQQKPIALDTASALASGVVDKIKSQKMDAKTAGEFLVDGVNLGIGDQSKQSSVFRTVSSFAGGILSTLKAGLKEGSPSKASRQYGEWLIEGFNLGVNDEKNNALNSIDKFSDDIIHKMQNAVNIQTGKMSFSGTNGTINQILTASGTTTVVNENKLLLDGDVIYENQNKVKARKKLQTQFGGAYYVST